MVWCTSDTDPPVDNALSLLQRLAERRDAESFAAVFRHFAPRIKQYLIGRGAPPHVCDELVQESMLILWRKAGQFDATRGTATTWIFVIVRSCYVDRIRRERRAEVAAADPILEDQLPAADAPDSAVEAATLTRALDTLPVEQSHVLRRAYYLGLSLQDIASAERLPLGTVKTRARLGLARLRELLLPAKREAS
jgi:RNA polymerase sigma-70 factor (ECF subfamily)